MSFLSKTTNLNQVAAQIAAQHRDLGRALKPILIQRCDRYITTDDAVRAMLRNARLMAPRHEPVLISGESGTGKELVARILLNDRPESLFFPVNCAGIPDGLFESILFGHAKGSFTGANYDHTGILVRARNGVVFFDEVGELPLNQQAKLLRALQERKVMPVGSTIEIPITCRFVFATNRNLVKEVAEGRFREDLFWRMCALQLHTIPLRERPNDAPIIVDDFCESNDYQPPDHSVPDDVIQSPGNVRALQAWVIQNAVLGDPAQ